MKNHSNHNHQTAAPVTSDADQAEVKKKIDTLLEQTQVVLFMKGSAQSPMCGFSARAVTILKQFNIPFLDVDVLQDPSIREGIKTYGNWPTIPQLYIQKKLVGGSDIMLEMYQSGELKTLLQEHNLVAKA